MATRDRTPAVGGDQDGSSERPVDRTRRRVLGSLQSAGCPLSLADLALDVARADESEEDVWARAECHWIELYHNHVPALEAAGLVEYHPERRTVSIAPGALQQFDERPAATVPA